MKALLLTRHGESEFNASGRINADPRISSPLTERGEEQAIALGVLLAEEQIDLCITSEHERAITTADVALEGRTITRLVLPNLNEPRAGALEGDLASRYDDRLRRKGMGSPNPGGGESQLDALRRYIRAYEALEQRSEHVQLVVAHGMPIRWLRLARRLTPVRAEMPIEFSRPNVDFAGTPDVYDAQDLRRRLVELKRYLSAVDG